MRAGQEHASSGTVPTPLFDSIIEYQQSPFVFSPPSLPDMGLTFLPRPLPRPRKRSRAATDIDGEHSCMQKKKRRLRLFLITSRLSPQFSHPATNIVDRGSSKIAVWAKQRSLGRNLLRKAAILNHIRHRALCTRASGKMPGHTFVEQEREQEELALAKLEFNHGNVDTYTRPVTLRTASVPPAVAIRTGGRFVVSGSPSSSPSSSRSPSPTPPSPPLGGRREGHMSDYASPNEAYAHLLPIAQIPRRDYIPLPPSPLGLSNYDAFDADDDARDLYSRFDEDEDGDEHVPVHIFGDEDDADEVPFTPSIVTATSSSTLQTTVSHSNTPLPPMQSDMEILNHGEPVIGDYDQVEQGAEAVWPSVSSGELTMPPTVGSTSPNFAALLATAPPKRADSFATSPNFRPTISKRPSTSISPNFLPITSQRPVSPNFYPTFPPTCTSPNFVSSSSIPAFAPPAVSHSLVATGTLPQPYASDAPSQRRMSLPNAPHAVEMARQESDLEKERRRQREIMFMRFGS